MLSKLQSIETSRTENESEAVASSRGLFYQPRGWMQSEATESAFAEPQTGGEKLAGNWGLFYRRGEWSMFGRPQAPQSSYTHAQSEIETLVARRGLLHRAPARSVPDKPAAAEKNVRRSGRLQPATVLAR